MRIAIELFPYRRVEHWPKILERLVLLSERAVVRRFVHFASPYVQVRALLPELCGPDGILVEAEPPAPFVADPLSVAQTRLLSHVDVWRPDWVFVQLDDRVPSRKALDELFELMRRPEVHLIRANSAIVWDGMIRRDIYPICDPIAWRWRAGQFFDEHRQLLAPVEIMDTEPAVVLSMPVLDYSYATAEDRLLTWRHKLRSGAVDALALAMVEEPRELVPISKDLQ